MRPPINPLCQSKPASLLSSDVTGVAPDQSVWPKNGYLCAMTPPPRTPPIWLLPIAWSLGVVSAATATPANKAALLRHYERFLPKERQSCTTCHVRDDIKDPQSLDELPHNVFGARLRTLGDELKAAGQPKNLPARLAALASEDSDGDGIVNEVELLAGSNPGDAKDAASPERLALVAGQREELHKFLSTYRWEPFQRVRRPPVPTVKEADWVRTPIDAFIAAEHEQRGVRPRPEASKGVLLRRLYLDLVGLTPTPDEQRAFAEDHSSDAYEKVVDRLLADPRYGERWGRHWMDIWRYSDWAGWTDGKQVRDSQRHIWRWSDWIVASLNADKGYDRMVLEMLAGDELAPSDPDTLRATGFLVRNYKMLSREQWLEDTVKHTTQAFFGVTVGCAKCHDHMTDPISQAEYYELRAIFEPHQVRVDRVPGELDIEKNGLARVYDTDKESPTYFFIRGDERKPDKNRVMPAAVPRALSPDQPKPELEITPVPLPREAAFPDRRDFVIAETLAASEQALSRAREALQKAKADAPSSAELLALRELESTIAQAKHAAVLAELAAERCEEQETKASEEWKVAAREVTAKQREIAVLEAQLAQMKAMHAEADAKRRLEALAQAEPSSESKAKSDAVTKELEAARKKSGEASQALAKVKEEAGKELNENYKPRTTATYPAKSTGRRLAFARWVANADHPLTARVAVNHLWLRHFGRGLVTTPENFGLSGAPPSHPALLDWLAAELTSNGWSMKALHRTIVTSSTYRMASTPDAEAAAIDMDNVYLWRMPTRRMEAELVRDNVLHVSGSLDPAMGGPEIDHAQGLTSRRRSLYLRSAAEKEVEFLKIFDGPSVNECYQRRPSVMPQQALALANSELALTQAKLLAKQLTQEAEDETQFITRAFARILAREPSAQEKDACLEFLRGTTSATPDALLIPVAKTAAAAPPVGSGRRRENLILVLFNHNDFVTIR